MSVSIAPPSWAVAAADQRIALMMSSPRSPFKQDGLEDLDLIMLMLTEPDEDSTDKEWQAWEVTCDNCGRYSALDMVSGVVTRFIDGKQVTVVFGSCPDCMRIK